MSIEQRKPSLTHFEKKNWFIRKYKEGDELQINNLFNLVFSAGRSLREWRWKFAEEPFMGKSSLPILVTVAESDGIIIGLYANLPIVFKVKDLLVRAAQPVDNMVHPSFQGTVRVIRDLFAIQRKRAVEDKIQFGFGVPNRRYYPVGKRFLKYKDVCLLPTLFRRLNWRLGVRKRLPNAPPFFLKIVQIVSGEAIRLSLSLRKQGRGVNVFQVNTFDDRINRLWEHAKERYGIMTIRDRRFLNWRYVEKPDGHYSILLAEENNEIIGYVVLKMKKDTDAFVGFIVDLLSIEQRVDEILIRAALNRFLLERVDYVLCRALREDRFYTSLVHFGFREQEFFPPTPIVYVIFSENIDENFLKDPRNWHFTYGDQLDVEF